MAQEGDVSNYRSTDPKVRCRPTSRFPSLSRPWTRVVVVHEAPHMTSPTEGRPVDMDARPRCVRSSFLLRLGRGELVDGAYGDVDEVVLAIAVVPGCLGRGEAGEGGGL